MANRPGRMRSSWSIYIDMLRRHSSNLVQPMLLHSSPLLIQSLNKLVLLHVEIHQAHVGTGCGTPVPVQFAQMVMLTLLRSRVTSANSRSVKSSWQVTVTEPIVPTNMVNNPPQHSSLSQLKLSLMAREARADPKKARATRAEGVPTPRPLPHLHQVLRLLPLQELRLRQLRHRLLPRLYRHRPLSPLPLRGLQLTCR